MPIRQALWTALETELEMLASTHVAEVLQLQATFEAALAAAPPPPPLEEQRGTQTEGQAGRAGATVGTQQAGGDAEHAAQVASMQEAFVARQAAAQEEVELMTARLADAEVRAGLPST